MGEHEVNASNQLFVLSAAKKHHLHQTQKHRMSFIWLENLSGGKITLDTKTMQQNSSTKSR